MRRLDPFPLVIATICLAGCASVPDVQTSEAAKAGQLDFLAGDWTIHDAQGTQIGSSHIIIQVPGTMLYEERVTGDKPPQSLWLENAERNGGWTQLFVGPAGQTREFPLLSAPDEWPVVMGADVTLQDGRTVKFRMTVNRHDRDHTQRVLELSPDDGNSWKTIFDYHYRRQQ